VTLALVVRLENWDLLVLLVLKEIEDLEEIKVLKAKLDVLVLLDHVVKLERKEVKEREDFLGHEDRMDQLESKVKWDLLVSQVQEAKRVKRVHKVHMDHLVTLEIMEIKAQWERWEKEEEMEKKVIKDYQGLLVTMVP
jgi:hypothetical protein